MTTRPRATYDPEADAIGFYFAPAKALYRESEEVAPGIVLDYDHDGRVIGVEILGVRDLLETRSLPATPAQSAPSAE